MQTLNFCTNYEIKELMNMIHGLDGRHIGDYRLSVKAVFEMSKGSTPILTFTSEDLDAAHEKAEEERWALEEELLREREEELLRNRND